MPKTEEWREHLDNTILAYTKAYRDAEIHGTGVVKVTQVNGFAHYEHVPFGEFALRNENGELTVERK